MSDRDRRLQVGLLVLRLTLGIFFLQWAIEKFVNPGRTLRIFGHLYQTTLPLELVPIMGILKTALALVLLAGAFRRLTYGIAFVLHLVSVCVTWPLLINPYDPTTHNHVFLTGVPVLAALWLLYLVREKDAFSFDGWRAD